VSQDPDEPDISTFEDAGIRELDRFLESEIRSLMARDGREMIRWMSTHLNHRSFGKALVTAYIARDQGRERQYIDVRLRVRDRNVVVGGCFDVSRAEDIAKPIFFALNDVLPLDTSRPIATMTGSSARAEIDLQHGDAWGCELWLLRPRGDRPRPP
jgi:hypothetical protein